MPPSAPKTGRFGGRSVLIVDDEQETLDVLELVLSADFPGLEVLAATKGIEAVTIARARRLDAVIVDYKMPDMNGLELLARLREAKLELPTIMLTGHPDLNVVAEAVNAGLLSAFLVKPVDRAKLQLVLAKLLARHAGSLGRIPPSR